MDLGRWIANNIHGNLWNRRHRLLGEYSRFTAGERILDRQFRPLVGIRRRRIWRQLTIRIPQRYVDVPAKAKMHPEKRRQPNREVPRNRGFEQLRIALLAKAVWTQISEPHVKSGFSAVGCYLNEPTAPSGRDDAVMRTVAI